MSKIRALPQAGLPGKSPHKSWFYEQVRGIMHVLNRQELARRARWLDVREDFGAKGNNSADEYGAIQRALDAVPDAGGTVFFPPGIYRVSTKLQIRNPSTRLMAFSGASFRAGAVGESAPLSLTKTQTALVGTTESMTLLEYDGVDAGGSAIEQAGPVIENISFWDDGGRVDGTPGTMKLIRLRMVNNWAIINSPQFWGATGVECRKADEDCGGWTISRSAAAGCTIGHDLDTFHGLVDSCWYSLCGTYVKIARADGTNRPGGVRVSRCKFDIRDPANNATYSPGIGIDVGLAADVYLHQVRFEAQPSNVVSPEAIGVRVAPSDALTTDVYASEVYTKDLNVGFDATLARSIYIDKMRSDTTAGVGGSVAAPIRITDAAFASVKNVRTDLGVTDRPIKIGTAVDEVILENIQGTVEIV